MQRELLTASGAVLGVDAYKSGWVGVRLTPGGGFDCALAASEIQSLVAGAGELVVVAVDIPIGLPDMGPRRADFEARRRLLSLKSSVFSTPTRGAMKASSYAEAVAANRRATGGTGISRQAWGLTNKILAVDSWVRSKPDVVVVEAHPEVSFAEMAGHPLTSSKRTWAGMTERRGALAAARIDVPDLLGSAGHAGADDVLDAAAAAWTAWRVATKTAKCLPEIPEVFSDGINASIWY